MTDHPAVPDYALPDSLDLESPEQYRALFETTRQTILTLLSERAATTSELAEALGRPKGTVGHHLKVLADAGLVRVVRTKRVRALQAKYYGRTARTFWYNRIGQAEHETQRVLSTVNSEIAQLPEELARMADANIRYVRIDAERALEWHTRLNDLISDFAREPRSGDRTWAMAFALYPTMRAALPTNQDEQS